MRSNGDMNYLLEAVRTEWTRWKTVPSSLAHGSIPSIMVKKYHSYRSLDAAICDIGDYQGPMQTRGKGLVGGRQTRQTETRDNLKIDHRGMSR